MMLHSPLRGRPLHILVLVLGGWIGLRVATWTPPQWRAPPVATMTWPSFAWPGAHEDEGVGQGFSAEGFARGPVSYAGGTWGSALDGYGAVAGVLAVADVPGAISMAPAQMPSFAGYPPPPAWPGEAAPQYRTVTVPVPMFYTASTAPMFGAARPALTRAVWLADNGLPPGLPGLGEGATESGDQALTGQSIPAAPAPVPLSPGLAQGKVERWSADMWMLARKETPMPLASGRPVYGGSQAGAVLRYHIAPESGHRPLAYLRATAAMGAVKESEIALGVGARPIGGIPVVLAAEARGFRSASGHKSFRPAVLAYTELPPFSLPLGMSGEAYLQGGYVAGMYKTPFVDGQVRVDRKIAEVAGASLRLGAGIWGGAQKGASRLDAGPGASAMVNIWGVPSRVSLDWRFRVLGDAQPKSGPALTISSGF